MVYDLRKPPRPQEKSYFTSLEGKYYSDPEIFEREYAAVFSRQWMYVGHLSQIARTGDYIVREIAGESLIIMRGDDRSVHALFNVCRHRGSRLCDDMRGSVRKRIICPYHQWAYGVDGELVSAQGMADGEDFDFAEFGLRRAHVKVWHDLIFINLSTEAPPFLDERAPDIESRLVPYELGETKVGHEIGYEVNCNWKLMVENFLECYHCRVNHPDLCKTFDISQISSNWDEIEDYEVSGFVTPLHAGKETASTDGGLVVKKRVGRRPGNGAGATDAVGGDGVVALPVFFYVSCWADHIYLTQVIPLATNRTQKLTQWLVHKDAQEGRDYEVDRLIALMDGALHEDFELVERTQKGVESRVFSPGPINALQEPMIRGFVHTYEDWMGLTRSRA